MAEESIKTNKIKYFACYFQMYIYWSWDDNLTGLEVSKWFNLHIGYLIILWLLSAVEIVASHVVLFPAV